MDNSFTLLSSMSPKINKTHKSRVQHKAPTLLALKKNIRRSSIFDNFASTEQNNSLVLVEGSTTNSTDSNSLYKDPNVVNTTPIIISDSDISESDQSNLNRKKSNQNDCVLSASKLFAINNWVLTVNSATKNRRSSLANKKFDTLYGSLSKDKTDTVKPRFSEALKSMAANLNISLKECDVSKYNSDEDTNKSGKIEKNNLFDISELLDRLDSEKKACKTQNQPGTASNSCFNSKYKDVPDCNNIKCTNVKSVLTAGSKKTNTDQPDDVISNSSSDGMQDNISESGKNLLDELYGNKWRHIKDSLPKSEPRSKKSKSLNNKKVPKTEKKCIPSFIHKNPYLETEQRIPVRTSAKVVESPWTKQLAKLCDSDSSDESVNDIIRKYINPSKTKLSFSDEDNDKKSHQWLNESINSTAYILSREKPIKKKEIISLSSSSDSSDNVESLEDKLRRKLVFDDKAKPSVSVVKKKGIKVNTDDLSDIKDKKKNKIPIVKTKKTVPKNKTNDVLKKKPVQPLLESKINKKHDSNLTELKQLNSSNSCFSFLASLSKTTKLSQCDPAARIFRNNFQRYRDELTTRLFKLYNETVFNNAIPDDSPLEWNEKMRKTAGYCYCRKIIRRTGLVERKVRIVLSTKVTDSADRLRDTLIHELCHAATWIVNQISNGHGDYWKAWAAKARQVFPELPPIQRCHDYVINTKYTYKCIDCGYSIGRHSKSLNIEKKRCGYCYGKFEVLLNKKSKDGETKSVPTTPKKPPTGFALFVKQNYATYKTPQLNHGQVMRLLGQKFNELKV